MIEIEARVIAFSRSFKGKDGKDVDYPKLTLRVAGQIVEMPVRGVDPDECEKLLDTDVVLDCDIYPAKTKQASLRVVGVKA